MRRPSLASKKHCRIYWKRRIWRRKNHWIWAPSLPTSNCRSLKYRRHGPDSCQQMRPNCRKNPRPALVSNVPKWLLCREHQSHQLTGPIWHNPITRIRTPNPENVCKSHHQRSNKHTKTKWKMRCSRSLPPYPKSKESKYQKNLTPSKSNGSPLIAK